LSEYQLACGYVDRVFVGRLGRYEVATVDIKYRLGCFFVHWRTETDLGGHTARTHADAIGLARFFISEIAKGENPCV
jgi:hypothetical protein